MNTSTLRFLALLPTVVVGCRFGDGFAPYYGNGGAPTIGGLDITSETSNVGGQTVTVSGSNFGGDPEGVTVVFGSRNAHVLKAADSELVVEVPPGPLQAGKVDVSVGTAQGQATLTDGYDYDVGDIDDEEIGFITVTNDYWSCLGGIGNTLDPFCQEWAFSGDSGVDGRGEFLQWVFPRLHSVYTGERGGFATSSDISWGEWSMQVPSYSINTLDLEDEYKDWRFNVSDFKLTNPVWGDEKYCSDMSVLAQYRYNGYEYDSNQDAWLLPTSVTGGSTLTEQANCETDAWGKEYALDTLNFCQEKKYQTTYSEKYVPEWPVGEDFFSGMDSRDNPSPDYPSTVVLDAPGIGVNGLELTLPEYAFFGATIGSAVSGTDQDTDWAVYQLSNTCPDSDGDGVTELTDAAWQWEWAPTQADLSPHGPIRATRTYVRATVSAFTLAWYGGEGMPVRASITVPDDWNYDETTGMSHLDLPTSILYQFPSSNLDYGAITDPFSGSVSGFKWGDPLDPSYNLLIITLERVTEYAIDVDIDGEKGVVMFAYSTGDVGQIDFTSPLDRDDCGDCIDGDGDGWTDGDDPDCEDGDVEANSAYGDYTCNDGIDNDGNGFIDAEDPNCTTGTDGETNCSNGLDDDGDGLVDEADGECKDGDGVEEGADDPTWGCINGLDDDTDGWVDFEDPDCVNGADDEVGYGDTECNDGADNDGHADIDADDFTCRRRGADYDHEEPTQSNECTDKVDNDSDGYTDGNDPDCEYNGYDERDTYGSIKVDDHLPACYNGEDDDGDGWVDAEDPGCVNEAGDPDGWVADEDASNPGFSACEDSTDNDGDGWFDGDDPDCATGGGEWGYGTTQCNNGADDDSDTFVDSDDSQCTDASDDDEGS